MRTGTKIGLIGLAVSAVTSIIFGIIEIKDARKGKRRFHNDDINLIAELVVLKQEERNAALNNTTPEVVEP